MSEAVEPLLEVRDLHAGFRTDAGLVRAVDGVSFAVQRGETFGIVGESGSGKSALALSLLGLLPASATVSGGEVRFAGRDLRGMPAAELRRIRGRRIAMVFQDPMTSLNPYQRVGAQVAEQIRLHLGVDAAEARARTLKLLDAVGIPDPGQRIDRYPHELSGGQRQRVLIAMALSCDPDLIIADEPTTALDVTVQAQVLDLLRSLQRSRNLGLILITHNLGVVAGMCDRVAVMYAGRIVEEAPVRKLFAAPSHPYTRGLLAALPRLDDDRHQPLRPIPGLPPRTIGAIAGCTFAPRCPHAEERCRREAPELLGDGHRRRCHVDLPAWSALASGARR